MSEEYNYRHLIGLLIGALIGFVIGLVIHTENSIGIGLFFGAIIGEIFGLAIVLGDSDIRKFKKKKLK